MPDKKPQAAPDFIPADAPDFIPADGGAISTPSEAPHLGDLRPASNSAGSWLSDLSADLRGGGGRTFVGRGLGHLQGNGDKGYAGLESGVSPGQADAMGSFALGPVKMAQGVQETPEHPVAGPLKMIGGALQTASLPAAFMGGPIAETAIEAVPSAKYAGNVLSDIRQAAQDVPVRPNAAWEPLERYQDLTKTGGATAKPTTQLTTRLQNLVRMPERGDFKFPEARDFYSNISSQSAEDMSRLNPVMRRQMGAVRAGLHQDLTSAADTIGRGQEYSDAVREYARAMQLRKALIYAGKYGAGAVGAGLAAKGLKDLIPSR